MQKWAITNPVEHFGRGEVAYELLPSDRNHHAGPFFSFLVFERQKLGFLRLLSRGKLSPYEDDEKAALSQFPQHLIHPCLIGRLLVFIGVNVIKLPSELRGNLKHEQLIL